MHTDTVIGECYRCQTFEFSILYSAASKIFDTVFQRRDGGSGRRFAAGTEIRLNGTYYAPGEESAS